MIRERMIRFFSQVTVKSLIAQVLIMSMIAVEIVSVLQCAVIDSRAASVIEYPSVSGTVELEEGNLNVRKGPSTSYGIIEKLSNGTKVKITGYTSDNWLRITLSKGVGYVDGTYVKVPVSAVSVSSSLTLYVGSSATLKATLKPPFASNQKVTWSSNSKAIATVSSTGQVEGIKAGSAVITVKTSDGGKTAKCKVTVKPVLVTSVTIPASLSVYVGSSSKLNATIKPTNATNKTVSWSSSNKAIATVDSKGNVKGIKAGTAKITVKTADGGKTDVCSVTVKIVPVASVTLPSTLSLDVGYGSKLTPTINPSNAGNKNVTWTSSNTKVATVDASGNVKGIAQGTAKITVKTADGGKTAICTVTVKIVPVASVTLPDTMTVFQGDSVTLTPTVYPEHATNKEVTWVSDNQNIATVDKNGLVTGIQAGTVNITVTTDDGEKKALCAVTVKTIPVTAVQIEPTSLSLNTGYGAKISATVEPANATNKKLIWTSSNKAVTTVDADGNVKGIKAGSATITVKSEDSGITAECSVIVKNVAVGSVVIKTQSLTVNKDATKTLTATVSPSNATNKKLTWTSSNKSVATVNASGVVKGIKAGNAVITVKTADGGKTSKCNVTVKYTPVKSVKLNRTNGTINIGYTAKLTATIAPSGATNKNLTWTSSNKSIATVDSKGVVKGIKEGKATITVKTVDGGKTARCAVTVKRVSVSSIAVSPSAKAIYLSKTYELTCVFKPSNASNKSLKWTSSSTKIATVDKSGKVTAKAHGFAIIRAKSSDGGKQSQSNVSVVSQYAVKKTGTVVNVAKVLNARNGADTTCKQIASLPKGAKVTIIGIAGKWFQISQGSSYAFVSKDYIKVDVPVTSVSLPAATKNAYYGTTYKIVTTIKPSSATNKNVKWSSSDTSVVSVDSGGVATMKKVGTATITVRTNNGGFTAKMQITVLPVKVTGIKISPTSRRLCIGAKYTLKPTISPSNASNKKVTWSSSNTTVATVNSSGVVVSKKAGTATITATTVDQGKTAACKITVKNYSITEIKKRLNALGYVDKNGKKLTVDGKWDNNCNYAMKAFQKQAKLSQEGGYTDPPTLTKLFDEGAPKAPAADIDRILNNIKNSKNIPAAKEAACLAIAEALLNEKYEVAFVAGMLGNVCKEGNTGSFENSHYISDPSGEPDYLRYMDKYYNYRSQYSQQSIYNGKSVTTVYNILVKFNKAGWKINGSRVGFGLGSIQWTFSRSLTLVEKYREENGNRDKITKSQTIAAESKMVYFELSRSYTNVYNDWLRENRSQLNTQTAAKNAGRDICIKYEKPKEMVDNPKDRGNLASKIYKDMVK